MAAEPPRTAYLASPCIGTCRLDPATGWCVGCGRDADELTRWRDLDADQRAAVWAALPKRLRQLGQDGRLLPWTPEDALAGIAMLAKAPGAVLVMGVEGATAEFMAAPGSNVLTRQCGPVLELHARGARARLIAQPGLRVFQGSGRLALTLQRSRFAPMPEVISELGPDGDALRAADRSGTLIDLGLGRPGLRFAVRLAEPALLALARRHLGQSLFDEAGELIAALSAAATSWVLITPLGRIEIEGHRSPQTQLSPDDLAAARPLVSGLALPEAYVASALVLEPAVLLPSRGDRLAKP